MKHEVGEAEAAAITAEVRSAATERRAPRVDANALADWVVTVERLFRAGELDAVEHTVRHLHAAFPHLNFARNLCGVFDRIPAADGQLPFTDDPDKDVQIVERPGADAVILLFCGFANRPGLPLVTMHRWFGKLPAHLVYLRDFRRRFYLRDIPSFGKDRGKTLHGLREIVRRLGARRILCYGNSGGVFAALHYGVALQADAVVCLSGPTNLWPEFSAHPNRSVSRVRIARELGTSGIELDARRSYEAAECPPPTLVLFAADNWDDRIQAEHLRDLPTVTLQAVPDTAEHNIILALVRRGDFESVLAWMMEPGGELSLTAAPARAPAPARPLLNLAVVEQFRKLAALFVRARKDR